jgi:hypothetical protein
MRLINAFLLFTSITALAIAIAGLVVATTAGNNDALVRTLQNDIYILQSVVMSSNMNATTRLIQNGTVQVRLPIVNVPYRLYEVDFGQFISYAVEVDPIPAPLVISSVPRISLFDPPIYPVLPFPVTYIGLVFMPESELQKIIFVNPPLISNRWFFEYELRDYPESFRLHFNTLDSSLDSNNIQWLQPVRFYFGPVPKFQLINP